MTWLKHPVVLLAFTLLSALFSLSLYSSWKRNQVSSAEVSDLEGQVADMSQNVANLQNQVQAASDSATQEKIIRDQLLMQKDGEVVLQIPDVGSDTATENQRPTQPKPLEEWQAVLFN